jgi:hypothetical protein
VQHKTSFINIIVYIKCIQTGMREMEYACDSCIVLKLNSVRSLTTHSTLNRIIVSYIYHVSCKRQISCILTVKLDSWRLRINKNCIQRNSTRENAPSNNLNSPHVPGIVSRTLLCERATSSRIHSQHGLIRDVQSSPLFKVCEITTVQNGVTHKRSYIDIWTRNFYETLDN